MAGQAEVRLTLRTSDYQLLQALLKYQAQKITADDLTVILKTLEYSDTISLDRQIVFCAEQLVNSIR